MMEDENTRKVLLLGAGGQVCFVCFFVIILANLSCESSGEKYSVQGIEDTLG